MYEMISIILYKYIVFLYDIFNRKITVTRMREWDRNDN